MDTDRCIRLLSRHGIHPTSQRVEIARLLFERDQHVSADNILATLKRNSADVSKATVYNTLALFCAKGMLRTVDVDSDRQYYDTRTDSHHHFYNVDTGELFDIAPEDVDLSISAQLPPGTEKLDAEVIVRIHRRPHAH